jgi:hypothetical protein
MADRRQTMNPRVARGGFGREAMPKLLRRAVMRNERRYPETAVDLKSNIQVCENALLTQGGKKKQCHAIRISLSESVQNLAFFAPRTRIGFGFPASAAFQNLNI